MQTLILDGLNIPVDLITEIITHDSFNVRLLSLRDVQHLNQRKLQQALLYVVRPSRPHNPTLQGLYIFGPKDALSRPQMSRDWTESAALGGGVTTPLGAQIGAEWNPKSEEVLAEELGRNSDRWHGKVGRVFSKQSFLEVEWADVIQACQGIISFDAVNCAGPRHHPAEEGKQAWYNQNEFFLTPRVATHALDGCSGCGRAPEGYANIQHSPPYRLPLMAPPPISSSTVKCAKLPAHGGLEKQLLVRCMSCLRDRYCESCQKWWCEDCYEVNPGPNLAEKWRADGNVKVHMGLCTESCLVKKMMPGAGSNGMWG